MVSLAKPVRLAKQKYRTEPVNLAKKTINYRKAS